jgi:hypothetical protein
MKLFQVMVMAGVANIGLLALSNPVQAMGGAQDDDGRAAASASASAAAKLDKSVEPVKAQRRAALEAEHQEILRAIAADERRQEEERKLNQFTPSHWMLLNAGMVANNVKKRIMVDKMNDLTNPPKLADLIQSHAEVSAQRKELETQIAEERQKIAENKPVTMTHDDIFLLSSSLNTFILDEEGLLSRIQYLQAAPAAAAANPAAAAAAAYSAPVQSSLETDSAPAAAAAAAAAALPQGGQDEENARVARRVALERRSQEVTARRVAAQDRLDTARKDKLLSVTVREALDAEVAALVAEDDLVDGQLYGYYSDAEKADRERRLAELKAEAERAASIAAATAAAVAAAAPQQ